jgi:colanic acid/amylovoran biosynthesis glycosyltransferase
VQWGRAASYWTEVGALLGMKLILSFRGAHINYAPLSDLALAETYRKVFPKFDAFHAVSEAIASEGRKYTSGNPLVRVIHSGINIAKTEISTRKSAPQNSPGTIRILSVGRFHWKKGYPVAFEAIRKLTGEGIRLKYELVAGGDDEEVVYMVNDMNLRDQVVFHGNMSQQQVFELMKECDLLLLPSVEEGIANVVLEAMAVGLPVISSDCGGMAEAVLEGETGLLFRSRNSDHLAARIREFLQMDAGKKSKMIMAARKHIHDNFSMERLGKEMDRLYKDVEQSKTGK